jgi:membrane protein DedA with SNARE-associated domain
VLIPKALAGPIQALINFLSSRLTVPQITGICFAAVVLLPFGIVLPAQPFMWVAGLALPFWTAYGVVMAASAVGMGLQYWAARYIFKERVSLMRVCLLRPLGLAEVDVRRRHTHWWQDRRVAHTHHTVPPATHTG